MQKLKISKRSCIVIGIICIALTALLISNISSLVDYSIIQSASTDIITCDKTNCIIQGRYNNSSISMDYWSIELDRRLSNDWLYKECNHNIGDDVKYFGQIHQGKFIIRRELC